MDCEQKFYHIFSFSGYKGRWFRLKGNLLFYFKADDHRGLSPEQEVITLCKT
jgi:hypothetical protein